MQQYQDYFDLKGEASTKTGVVFVSLQSKVGYPAKTRRGSVWRERLPHLCRPTMSPISLVAARQCSLATSSQCKCPLGVALTRAVSETSSLGVPKITPLCSQPESSVEWDSSVVLREPHASCLT